MKLMDVPPIRFLQIHTNIDASPELKPLFLNMKNITPFAFFFAVLLVSIITPSSAQQCSNGDFIVSNGQETLLKITAAKQVFTCGQVNICDQISNGLQTLSLSSDGSALSISQTNSVTLPDPSPTNELQTLSVNGGSLSISGGNSVELPDNSATNEIQQLAINDQTLSLSNNGGSVTLPDWRVWHFRKVITYTASIVITSTSWTAVQEYELLLNVPNNYSFLHVSLTIPYSSVSTARLRGRVQLIFDGGALSDHTMYGEAAYIAGSVHLFGIVPSVAAGTHVIQVKALVDATNSLLLPALGGAAAETITPAIFGAYNIMGFP